MKDDKHTHVDIKATNRRELKHAVKALVAAEYSVLALEEFLSDYILYSGDFDCQDVDEEIRKLLDVRHDIAQIRKKIIKIDGNLLLNKEN